MSSVSRTSTVTVESGHICSMCYITDYTVVIVFRLLGQPVGSNPPVRGIRTRGGFPPGLVREAEGHLKWGKTINVVLYIVYCVGLSELFCSKKHLTSVIPFFGVTLALS